MPAQPEAGDWLAAARIDLDSAERLLAHGGHPSVVCFHAQQAVEKFLKSSIAARNAVPARTHDLAALARAAGVALPAPGLTDRDLAFLTACYLAARYPDAAATPLEAADATRALAIARLALGGVPPGPASPKP